MQFHEWTMAKTVGIALLDLIYQDIIFSIKLKVTSNLVVSYIFLLFLISVLSCIRYVELLYIIRGNVTDYSSKELANSTAPILSVPPQHKRNSNFHFLTHKNRLLRRSVQSGGRCRLVNHY